MQKENEKYSWESQCEYEYRKETGKIAIEINLALKSIGEIVAAGTFDYLEVKERIDRAYKKVRYMISPHVYGNAHQCLQEALHSYAKALEILVVAAKNNDADGIRDAGNLIEEGNSFIRITKLRIWAKINVRIKEEEKRQNSSEGTLKSL